MQFGAYLQTQVQEAMGELNRYYCSKHYGKEISDPEILLRYYIKNGGSKDFREKTKQGKQYE